MAVQPNLMRDTLRLWGSGVAVVATLAEGTHPYAGMTVSTFNSLSLEPPLIFVSLDKASLTTAALLKSGVFSVSILTGDQAALSDRFSGRSPLPLHADRFDGVPTVTAVTGAPILQDALGWVDCRVHQLHDGSTHWLVIGEVLATGHKDTTTPPLIYFNRAYYAPTTENARVSSARAELDLVRRWHAALNGDVSDTVTALVAPDVEVGGPRGTTRGAEVVREWFGRANIHLFPLRCFARGTTVVVEQRGEWLSEDRSAVASTQTVATVFTVSSGLITRIMRYPDLESALKAAALTETDAVQ